MASKPVGGLFQIQALDGTENILLYLKRQKDRFEIQFDGVFRNASIWLNGFYIGTNQSGYVGKSYDVNRLYRF